MGILDVAAFRRKCGRRGERDNDGHLSLYKFIRHSRQPIKLTLSPARFDYNVAPFAIAYLSQALLKRRY
jgi:hypothetical protein